MNSHCFVPCAQDGDNTKFRVRCDGSGSDVRSIIFEFRGSSDLSGVRIIHNYNNNRADQ